MSESSDVRLPTEPIDDTGENEGADIYSSDMLSHELSKWSSSPSAGNWFS